MYQKHVTQDIEIEKLKGKFLFLGKEIKEASEFRGRSRRTMFCVRKDLENKKVDENATIVLQRSWSQEEKLLKENGQFWEEI